MPAEDPLQQSAQFVRGVGPSRYALLRKLGIESVGDLLFYFPRAYEDFTDFRRIQDLEAGVSQTVAGEIVEIGGRQTRRGELLSIVISDGSGVVEGLWFNQTYLTRRFGYGMKVLYSGTPKRGNGHWQMMHPRIMPLGEGAPDPRQGGMVLPVYPLTEGLHAEALRRVMRNAVPRYADAVPEILPLELRGRRRLAAIGQALRDIHLPETMEAAQRARRRLVYEEFLILQLALAHRRRDVQEKLHAPVLTLTDKIDAHIRRLFPFTLTHDQNQVIREVARDMGQDRPMRRLLQADVGAGKTAVAVFALLLTVAHKCQAALMAPTEVLARQHWRTLSAYLAHSKVRRCLLTGGLADRERRTLLGEIRMGQLDLVVGTQALIQKDVEFQRLGLVVIDEQHRFGVLQRAQFRGLGESPHYLVMTATPIPRTVALTVFGDLDVSVMHELPPGRKPVVTKLVPERMRASLEQMLCGELDKGRQLFVVCPLVEGRESDASSLSKEEADADREDLKAAEQTYERLRTGVFHNYQVGLLHGRQDERVKEDVMNRFRDGKLHVLVCTTVVEVGVDVPNATLMVIEHAERFGLSQLHQLRGRVTRGPVAGECFLFAQAASAEARKRLQLFAKTTDGFALAEEDMRLRGMGQFFGTRQHGLGELRLGNLATDVELLQAAREDAFRMVKADYGLRQPEHAALRQEVLRRYGKTLELAEIG